MKFAAVSDISLIIQVIYDLYQIDILNDEEMSGIIEPFYSYKRAMQFHGKLLTTRKQL